MRSWHLFFLLSFLPVTGVFGASLYLVTKGPDGKPLSGLCSEGADLSLDGGRVVYTAFSKLNSGVLNGAGKCQLVMTDLTSAKNRVISVGFNGRAANDNVSYPSMSASSEKVLFVSSATNLVAIAIPGPSLFLWSEKGIRLVSVTAAGVPFAVDGVARKISGDGNFAVFSTSAAVLNGVSGCQTYRKNILTGEIALVSSLPNGTPAVGADCSRNGASISFDGNIIAFSAKATNFPGGTKDQIYRKNMATNELKLMSENAGHVPGNNLSWAPSLTSDGNAIAFESFSTNLVTNPLDSIRFRIFVADPLLQLASTNEAKEPATNGQLRFPALAKRNLGIVAFAGSGSQNLLTPPLEVPPNGWQVYLKNLNTGAVSLVSSPNGKEYADFESGLEAIDATGSRVLFRSFATNLLPEVNSPAQEQLYLWVDK